MDRVTIAQWDPEKLADAVRVWTGYCSEMYPNRSEVRLVAQFGAELASRLLPVLDELETEFYVSNAKYLSKDLAEMAEMAAREFQERFPTLPSEIAKAFAWCYTFDFK